MVALVLGERDEIRRLCEAYRRGDEGPVEARVGACMRPSRGDPQAEPVAAAVVVRTQVAVAGGGMNVLGAKVG